MDCRRLFSIIFLSIVSTLAFSQKVVVRIDDVKETRRYNSKDSEIELTIFLNGLEVDDKRLVKVSEVSAAEDDSGYKLKKKEDFWADEYSAKNKLTLKMEAPPFREAKQIKFIEGNIKYFQPTVENGAIKKFVELNRLKNKPLIQTEEVEVILLDEEALKEIRERDSLEFVQKMDSLKSTSHIVAGLAEAAEGFGELFSSIFDGFGNWGGNNEKMSFLIDDENDQIIDFYVYNAKGESMNSGSSQSNNLKEIYLKEKPKEDWYIEIFMETKTSVVEIPFRIENIDLP